MHSLRSKLLVNARCELRLAILKREAVASKFLVTERAFHLLINSQFQIIGLQFWNKKEKMTRIAENLKKTRI